MSGIISMAREKKTNIIFKMLFEIFRQKYIYIFFVYEGSRTKLQFIYQSTMIYKRPHLSDNILLLSLSI